MTDFIDEILAEDGPIARTVAYVNVQGERKSGEVYFRRISAGERQKLLAGQKYTLNRSGSESDVKTEIDLSANEQTKQMLVAYSVCDKSGKRRWASAADVAKLDALLVSALYEAASEVNSERDPGKS